MTWKFSLASYQNSSPGTRRVAAAVQRQQDQPLIYSSLLPGFATYVPRAGTV